MESAERRAEVIGLVRELIYTLTHLLHSFQLFSDAQGEYVPATILDILRDICQAQLDLQNGLHHDFSMMKASTSRQADAFVLSPQEASLQVTAVPKMVCHGFM